ncbi:hypothetical protein PCO31110_01586 [Pandoraea communis]|uniref:Uncharacterized protein n=1 Tax=Pandoraea communis TaxID=2508297 RepID=A0A5E4TUM7_9BURK|nr:hypothetical protein [Pandoraea communis]VVD90378.1 hypothetical protein PCO31110_01586 [Pandoraea communis]
MLINKTAAIFKPFAVESSVVFFNGRLLVMYISRVPRLSSTLVAADYFTGEIVASAPANDLTLGCALVIGTRLHYWGTRNVGPAGNSIWHMYTDDLVTWSIPDQAWAAGDPRQKIFNTSVCFDPDANRYVMAYETSEPYYGYVDFNIRWLVSTDLVTWAPYGNVFGSDRYVACPRIDYSNGYYYMHYLVTESGIYKTRVARATDPCSTWTESTKYALTPTLPDELTNTSDIDFCELGDNLYFTYAAGDQGMSATNAMDLKQAFAWGTRAAYLTSFFS